MESGVIIVLFTNHVKIKINNPILFYHDSNMNIMRELFTLLSIHMKRTNKVKHEVRI